MSIVGKLGGIEGQQTVSEALDNFSPGGGSVFIIPLELTELYPGGGIPQKSYREIKEAFLSGKTCLVYVHEDAPDPLLDADAYITVAGVDEVFDFNLNVRVYALLTADDRVFLTTSETEWISPNSGPM